MNEGGLTFVELLLAASIFALILVGLSAHLRGGVTAWRRTLSTVNALQRHRVALDQLGRDLANAVLLDADPAAQPPVQFSRDALRFYAVRTDRLDPSRPSDVAYVTYAWESVEGEPSLTRGVQTLREAKAGVPVERAPLLASVEEWAMRYAVVVRDEEGQSTGPIEWQDRWTDATQLPGLIEISYVAAPERIRRVFVVPSGTLSPAAQPG